jgi:hypothetical protein
MAAAEKLYYVIAVDVDPELEDEFNEWYDTVHLPQAVACPGFVSGRRLQPAAAAGPDQHPRYVAVYEVESRAAVTSPEIQALGGFSRWDGHLSNVHRLWLTPRGPLVSHDSPDGVAAGGAA